MCGIVGFHHPSIDPDAYPTVASAMLGRIAHRGPDESGIYVDDRLAMGTARLSIVDITGGRQPMSDESSRYWICFNGELYNFPELRKTLVALGYKFRSNSDTEVVLHSWMQWGEKSFERFNGPFALAIYDTLEDKIILARDRFGKRPLYYFEQGDCFLFASEMKAFLDYPGFRFELDSEQLACIFAHWTPLPHQSGFIGIKQLPLGSYMLRHAGRSTTRHYHRLNLTPESTLGNGEDVLQHIRNELRSSIARRLRSDAEVGVYLSGGLDSSIVASLAKELAPYPLKTFSVQFEHPSFDESEYQEACAQWFGTEHSFIRVSNQDIATAFPQAVYHAEVPSFRTAFTAMYLLSQHVRDSGTKVVLSGEGADEVFLGYNIFRETALRSEWHTLSLAERKTRISNLYPYLDHYARSRTSHLLGLYNRFASETMPGLFSHEIRFQNGRFSNRLLNEKGSPFRALYSLIERDPHYQYLDSIQKAQWLEIHTLLAGYLLSTQGERMSLAHGVENRCPFLDPELVRLASSVYTLADHGREEKPLLKNAFAASLPPRILARRKHAYRAPDAAAFIATQPDYLESILSTSELKKVGFLNEQFACQLVKKIHGSPLELIGTRENQAYILLLSTVLLHRYFCQQVDIPTPLQLAWNRVRPKVIDRRKTCFRQEKRTNATESTLP